MPPGRKVIIAQDDSDELLLIPSPQRNPQYLLAKLPRLLPFRPLPADTTKKSTTSKTNLSVSNRKLTTMASSASTAQVSIRIAASSSMAGKQSTARGTLDDPMVLSDYESSGAESDGIELLKVRKGPPRRDLHISGIQSISGAAYYGTASDSNVGVKGKNQKAVDGKQVPLAVKSKCYQSVNGPPINHPSSLREVFSPKKRSAESVPVDSAQPGPSKIRKTTAFSTPNTSRAPSPGMSTSLHHKSGYDSQQRVQKRSSALLDTLELTDSEDDRRTHVQKKARRDDIRSCVSRLPSPAFESAPEPFPPSAPGPPLPSRQIRPRRLPLPPPPPPPDTHLDVSDDSDYDFYHDGLVIHDDENWVPMKLNENKLELLATEMDQVSLTARRGTSEDMTLGVVLPSRNTTSFSVQGPSSTGRANFAWDKLRKVTRASFPRQYRSPVVPPSRGIPSVSRNLPQEHKLHALALQYRYRPCPRSINRIIQKDGWVVSCGACAGGGPDHEYTPDQGLDNENAPGALVAFARGSKEIVLNAHKQERFQGQQGITKYYAINDIQFLPFDRNSFMSTGADGVVQQWTSNDDHEEGSSTLDGYWTNTQFDAYSGNGSGSTKTPYPRIPFGVSFNHIPVNSSSCLAAITERKLNLYNIKSGDNRTRRQMLASYTLKNPNSPNLVGSTLWGKEKTANHLFASSEPQMANDFSGVHKAFDVAHHKQLYQFDAQEGGDDLALDPTGTTLALCTLAEGERNVLRLYDVARKSPSVITAVSIEEIHTPLGAENFTKEVSSAFSPDGILLSLARTDNSVHVYDARMLQNGPLFNYSHSNAPNVCANNAHHFGAVKAEWIYSDVTRRMGLVTAGEDGCVRLWDPMLAADNPGNGTILAEVDYDITTFSLGDRFKQEYGLVVGDSTGQVSLFDKLVI